VKKFDDATKASRALSRRASGISWPGTRSPL
jgi:hypothetical protein